MGKLNSKFGIGDTPTNNTPADDGETYVKNGQLTGEGKVLYDTTNMVIDEVLQSIYYIQLLNRTGASGEALERSKELARSVKDLVDEAGPEGATILLTATATRLAKANLYLVAAQKEAGQEPTPQ